MAARTQQYSPAVMAATEAFKEGIIAQGAETAAQTGKANQVFKYSDQTHRICLDKQKHPILSDQTQEAVYAFRAFIAKPPQDVRIVSDGGRRCFQSILSEQVRMPNGKGLCRPVKDQAYDAYMVGINALLNAQENPQQQHARPVRAATGRSRTGHQSKQHVRRTQEKRPVSAADRSRPQVRAQAQDTDLFDQNVSWFDQNVWTFLAGNKYRTYITLKELEECEDFINANFPANSTVSTQQAFFDAWNELTANLKSSESGGMLPPAAAAAAAHAGDTRSIPAAPSRSQEQRYDIQSIRRQFIEFAKRNAQKQVKIAPATAAAVAAAAAEHPTGFIATLRGYWGLGWLASLLQFICDCWTNS